MPAGVPEPAQNVERSPIRIEEGGHGSGTDRWLVDGLLNPVPARGRWSDATGSAHGQQLAVESSLRFSDLGGGQELTVTPPRDSSAVAARPRIAGSVRDQSPEADLLQALVGTP